MGKELIHKPVNLDKVKVKRRAILEQPGYLEANYDAEAKYDGCMVVMHLREAGAWSESRTGEPVLALDRVQQALLATMWPLACTSGVTLLGELWHPDIPQNELSGITRRQRPDAKAEFVVFDVLYQHEWEAGYSPVSKRTRRERMKRFTPLEGHWRKAEWVPAGEWDMTLLDAFLEDPAGYDGLVAVDPGGTWTRGKGTDGEQIKLKRTLSFDLRVVGGVMESPGAKTGRPVYTIDVQWTEGRTLRIGSGIPHDYNDVPKAGQIVEIHAMDYSAEGLLREPRFKSIRHDKDEADF